MKNDSGIGSKIILKFREPNASTSRLLKRWELASWEIPEFLMEKKLIPFFNTLKIYKCWLWTRGYGLGWEHFEVIVLEWWWLLCFEKREMECVCVGGKNPETYANSYFQISEFKIWVFGHWVVEDAGLNEWGEGTH
jgi:hypothetical protein